MNIKDSIKWREILGGIVPTFPILPMFSTMEHFAYAQFTAHISNIYTQDLVFGLRK